jgi:hypothetical protein
MKKTRSEKSRDTVPLSRRLKGTVAGGGFFAPCILSMKERKDFKFFSCCTSTGLWQDLTNLAHRENTHSEFFC